MILRRHMKAYELLASGVRVTRGICWTCVGSQGNRLRVAAAAAVLFGCSSNAASAPPEQSPLSQGGAVGQPGASGATAMNGVPVSGSGGVLGAGNVATAGYGNTGAVAPFGAGGSVGVGVGTGASGYPSAGGFVSAAGAGNTGGTTFGAGGASTSPGGTPVGGGGGPPPPPSKGCEGESMPPVTGDYSANGPMPTMTVNNTGPDGNYTIVRPTTLGAGGFKHPVATWGNGITTNPSYYPGLLGAVASHGFVIIASNSSSVTTQMMTDGLDWMLAQGGDYQGKLNTTCLAAFGYSLGGGAAVGAGAHANVVVTASMHGVTGAANTLHGPLLLLTSETDTFVVPATFVTPTFTLSTVQTFYGTLSKAGDPSNEGHLIPVDGALSLITTASANLAERAAVIAWLRLWVYSDAGAKKYFYGDDCILCKAPWVTPPQRKNWQ